MPGSLSKACSISTKAVPSQFESEGFPDGYYSVHKYVDTQATYLREGLWKKDWIFWGLRCKESIDAFTLFLKSSRLVIEVRPTVSALRCFHTSSSGFLSGEYGGR